MYVVNIYIYASLFAMVLFVLITAPLDVARDIDLEEQASDGEASDDSNMVSPSCTICLSVYENEEVVRAARRK